MRFWSAGFGSSSGAGLDRPSSRGPLWSPSVSVWMSEGFACGMGGTGGCAGAAGGGGGASFESLMGQFCAFTLEPRPTLGGDAHEFGSEWQRRKQAVVALRPNDPAGQSRAHAHGDARRRRRVHQGACLQPEAVDPRPPPMSPGLRRPCLTRRPRSRPSGSAPSATTSYRASISRASPMRDIASSPSTPRPTTRKPFHLSGPRSSATSTPSTPALDPPMRSSAASRRSRRSQQPRSAGSTRGPSRRAMPIGERSQVSWRCSSSAARTSARSRTTRPP